MTSFSFPFARAAAAAVLTASALAACGGSSGAFAQDRSDFLGGCQKAGPTASVCRCLITQIVATQGFNTDAKLKALSSDAAKLSGVQRKAANACKTG